MFLKDGQRSLGIAAVIASSVWAGAGFAEEGQSKEAWRLFVADHSQPIVRAIDFDTGAELGRYELKGHAALTASASGKTVFAAQSEADVVHAISTGIKLSDHGEHGDIEITAPALLPVGFEGARPFHVVPHDDHAIIFYDKGGKAEVVDETDLLAGKKTIRTIDTTAPHHGVAVSMGRHMLVSVPDMQAKIEPDELPPRLGLRVLDEQGKQVGDMATCTALHGEAMSARLVAFGCKEGVLIARPGGLEGPKLDMLAYPETLPKETVGTLLGGKSMQFFLGNFGADKVVLIDPDAAKPYRLVQLPTRRVDFALDPVDTRNAYVLTEDGNLHVLDVVKGEIVRAARVTEPYSKDGDWRDPRPRLAVADGRVAITDPRLSLVRVIDPQSLKEERTIAVDGQPFSIAAVGGTGVSH